MTKESRVKIRFSPETDMHAAETEIEKLPGVIVKVKNELRRLFSISIGPNGPTLEELRAIPGVLTADDEWQGEPDAPMPRPTPHDHGED